MSKSSGKKKNADGEMDIGRMVHFTGRFIKGQTSNFILAGLMLVLEAYTAVIIPLLVIYVIGYLTERMNSINGAVKLPRETPLAALGLPPVVSPDFDTIAIVTLGIVLLTMLNSLTDSLAEIYLARGGRRVGLNLRVALYGHLQKLSLAFHDQRRTGDIMTRVTSDVAALESFITSSLSDFVGSILTIFFILWVMLTKAWEVALVAAIIIPIMGLVSNYFTTRIKAASKRLRASEGELASAAQEMLTSIRVIQTYGLGSFEQAMFAKQSHRAMETALEAAAYQARFSWVVSVISAVSVAAVIWMGVYIIFRKPLTTETILLLGLYTGYIQDMFKPTKRIIQEWNTFGKLHASVERIGDLLDLKPSVQDEPGAIEARQLKGYIEFRDVSFTYPALIKEDGESPPRQTLQNIEFEIRPGQVLAVVGYTGAGKSTIAQLIPRLYDPTGGEVCIDGQNIRNYSLESLRSQMSMVLQESILFSGSVVENIAYGRPNATGAEILAAARQANAHEFIEKLPEGYYTMLGERGSNLSGGQRQRIAIARAFVRNTPILIMDEPTTGLDAESTDLVLRALKKLMAGKTTIIISHDLNLIRDADKILVIKAGQIEQQGTHEELLESGGLYANLYTRQTGHVAQEKAGFVIPHSVAAAMPITGGEKAALSLASIIDFDLPGSTHFTTHLPNLEDAFDDKYVTPILQDAMLHPGKYTITENEPGKAIFLPDHTCNMQYELKIRNNHTGKTMESVVNAILFPDAAQTRAYVQKNLEPLLSQIAGRLEYAPFLKPVAYIEPLEMAVSVFPVDGMMPTLIQATDPQRMIRIFDETLPEALSGNFVINHLKLELAHYGRYQRCVLRYALNGEALDGQSPDTITVYGKVDADGRGGLTVPVIGALRERLLDPDAPFTLRIPQSYGYLPDLKLLLMEAIPGQPVAKRLINNYRGDIHQQQSDGLSLAEAVETCARMAATIHWSGIRLGRRLPFQTKVASIQEELRIVQEVFPDLGNTLNAWLEEIVDYAESTPAMPLVFSHGDYTYTQLVFNGREAGLVDFDTVCLAEPALDLGQYIAYQRLSIYKEQDENSPFTPEVVEQLSELFLATYIDVARPWINDEALLRARVSIYEVISLIRLVIHSWQKLKGHRLNLAIQLLEERKACLKQIS